MADLITNDTWAETSTSEPPEASETTTDDDGRPPELKKGLPIKRVPSDDCLLYPKKMFETDEGGVPAQLKERGEGIAVHVGEWVEIVPMASMFQYLRLEKGSDLAFDAVCENLSKKIVRWNWTDILGDPYPQPFRNPAVLRTLEDDELVYLIKLLQTGETEGERKNA
ncbi:MAG: hypothetical protein IIC21_11730 [Chloroflexi bacterium]|nr:hypothetical protein [Chloroflexota bacterium]